MSEHAFAVLRPTACFPYLHNDCPVGNTMRLLTITIGDTQARFAILDEYRETGVTVTLDGNERVIPLETFLNSLFKEQENENSLCGTHVDIGHFDHPD